MLRGELLEARWPGPTPGPGRYRSTEHRDSPPQIDNRMARLSVCLQEINVNAMVSVVAFMFQNDQLTTRTGKTLNKKTEYMYIYVELLILVEFFPPDLSHNYPPFLHRFSLAELNKWEMVWNSLISITSHRKLNLFFTMSS